jgi:integrase
MAVRIIKKYWYVDFTIDYIRYRRRSPENSKSGAQAYEAVLRQKLARPGAMDRASQQLKSMPFEQFAWQWFDDYVIPNNKFSEHRAKRTILRLFLVPFFGRMPINAIGTHHIEQFKSQQVRAGVSLKTLRNRLTVLSKCLSCAHEWFALDTPMPKVKWPKCPPPRTDYLSAEECESLIAHSAGVIREMIQTALRTGMRQGELKGLQWSSVNWETRSVAVRHSYCDVRHVLDTPKSNKERHIPLDIDVFELLHRRKQSTGFVFLNPSNSQPFNSPKLNARLATVCKRAGLRKVTWHVLRHTFATQLAMKGVPLNTVQVLLGHSSITTTMRYAHVAPSTLRAAIDLLNPKSAANAEFGHQMGTEWMEMDKKANELATISSGR